MVEETLIGEICSLIGSSRSNTSLSQPSAKLPMYNATEFNIECLLAHDACDLECPSAVVVELWSIRTTYDDVETGLPPVFLKNAIRSHLHFSQLNSWIAGNTATAGHRCTYRFTSSSTMSQIYGCAIDVHEFPLCRLTRDTTVAVSVQCIKKDDIHLPEEKCSQLRQLPTDQWLLPSPTGSPPDTSMFVDIAGHNILKHKPLPAPPHSPDGPAPKFPALDQPDSECNRPARRALPTTIKDGEGTVDRLVLKLDALSGRGRQRTKSGGCISFNKVTGLPSHSSPAPVARQRNSLSSCDVPERRCSLLSAGLLGNFEESALHGRLDPVTQLDGFSLQIVNSDLHPTIEASACGSFSSPHTSLPVRAYFFDLNDDEPLPFLGTCSLDSMGRKGYRIPKAGVIQATLFNPQSTVVKVFIVPYDVLDMPNCSQTFLRQRWCLKKAEGFDAEAPDGRLQHLIHLRLATDRRGRLFLHTDIRMLFSQDSSLDGLNVDIKGNVGVDAKKYVLNSATERPRYSPKK